MGVFVFFKQKTAYEMRISDWSSDVCSSDLIGMINLGDMLGKMGQRTKRRRLKVPAAFAKLIEEEADRRLDQDEISREALANAEANGIVFLDEVDKIATADVRGGSVSRDGVQRDMLPLIEGTTGARK